MPKFGKGKPLSGQTREVIHNVAEYFIKHRPPNERTNYVKQTSEATGVSLGTVKRVVREGKKSIQSCGEAKFSDPGGKRGERKKRVDVDELKLCAVRRKIQEFYTVKNKSLNLRKLLPIVRKELKIKCGKEYLRALMKKIGFRWTKQNKNCSLYIEKQEIAAWRAQYLRCIRAARGEGRTIYFLDDTQLKSKFVISVCWQSPDAPCGKWRRLIVVNAIGGGGGVGSGQQEGTTIFGTSQEINTRHWTNEQMIRNLVPQSLIVMSNPQQNQSGISSDGSSCNGEKPTARSTKQDIEKWLRTHNVPFSDDLRKSELLELVKTAPIEPPPETLESVFESYGHVVWRLPPHHADLNPIQFVWRDIRECVSTIKASSSLAEVTKLCEVAFANYLEDDWKKCCDHVKVIEAQYWQNDEMLDRAIDNIIAHPKTSDSSSSDDESMSGSSTD